MHRASAVIDADYLAAATCVAFHFEHHLPIVDLGYYDGLDLGGYFTDAFLAERPDGDQAQGTDLDTFLARILNSLDSDAGGDAIRHHHDIGAVDLILVEADDLVGIAVDLFHQVSHDDLVLPGGHDRIPLLVVGQAGDVEVVPIARTHHGMAALAVELVGAAVFLGAAVVIARNDLDLVGWRDNHFFMHVADGLVGQDDDRNPVELRQVEGLDGEVETFLRAVRAQGDDHVVAMRAVARLHHVLLRGQRGQAGGRSAALHVGDHHRGFGHAGQAEVFHHQGKAGAAGHGHHLLPCPCRTDIGGDGGEFVFHLDEQRAHLRRPLGKALGGFR